MQIWYMVVKDEAPPLQVVEGRVRQATIAVADASETRHLPESLRIEITGISTA